MWLPRVVIQSGFIVSNTWFDLTARSGRLKIFFVFLFVLNVKDNVNKSIFGIRKCTCIIKTFCLDTDPSKRSRLVFARRSSQLWSKSSYSCSAQKIFDECESSFTSWSKVLCGQSVVSSSDSKLRFKVSGLMIHTCTYETLKLCSLQSDNYIVFVTSLNTFVQNLFFSREL